MMIDAMQQMASDINKMRRLLTIDVHCRLVALTRVAGDQLQRDTKSWLCPPDPSKNYNIGCEIHRDGTATWFFRRSVFAEWNANGSLLWIYGKREFSSLTLRRSSLFSSCSGFGKDYFTVGCISSSLFIFIHSPDKFLDHTRGQEHA